MKTHYISSKLLDFETIESIINERAKLALSEEAKTKNQKCRDYLDNRLKSRDERIYGINTGFGALHNVLIPASDMKQLQTNLLLSHACGAGRGSACGDCETHVAAEDTGTQLW